MHVFLLFNLSLLLMPPEDATQWMNRLETHRSQKDDSFRNDRRSPMFGSDRFTFSDVSMVSVALKEGEFIVEDRILPNKLILFKFKEGSWHWIEGSEGVSAFYGEKSLGHGIVHSGSEFRLLKSTLSVYSSGKKITFICFNPERETAKSFSHLKYFPPDQKYAVVADFQRLKSVSKVTMLTSQNQEKTYFRYAKLNFKIKGKQLFLFVYKMSLEGELGKHIFIPFTDSTTGTETYSAGRYLELQEPEGDKIMLDFNYAFNPLCNYSPAYNCPVPLEENALKEPIRAGEKTYPFH